MKKLNYTWKQIGNPDVLLKGQSKQMLSNKVKIQTSLKKLDAFNNIFAQQQKGNSIKRLRDFKICDFEKPKPKN